MSGRAFAFCRPGPAGVELCVVMPDELEAQRLVTRELAERDALELALRLVACVAGPIVTRPAEDKPEARRLPEGGVELLVPLPGQSFRRVALTDRRALELGHELLGRLCAQLAARNAAEVGGVGLPWGSA